MPRRRVYPQESILRAVDRLGAGFGASRYTGSDFTPMSMARAQEILRDTVEELLMLREETREWVCPKCRKVFGRPDYPFETCSGCGQALHPRHALHVSALEDQILRLQKQVEQLQQTLMIVLEYEESTVPLTSD